MKTTSAAPSGIRARAEWLASLCCSPLPVAPAQAEPIGKDGKPLFNGKNPSYLDSQGKPHIIRHTEYRDSQPTAEDLATWFANPANGIGTLTGQGGIDWIDLDRKNFDSQDACDNARAQILEQCDRTYFETTRSGGTHIAIKLAEPKGFTNFQIGTDGKHAGEFLGQGRFIVLAPTAGYVSQNGDEIASVQSAAALGLHPTGKAAQEAIAPRLNMTGPVALRDIIAKSSKDILGGSSDKDVSKALTQLHREAYACAEWYPSNGLALEGNPQSLVAEAAAKLGCDSDRLERITKNLPTTGGIPSLAKFKGEEAAKAWYAKLLKKSEPSADHGEPCKELQKIRALRNHYDGRLRFNQLSQKIEIDGEALTFIEGERIDYIEETNQSIGVDLFCTVLQKIAEDNSFHPVAIYLEHVSEKTADTSVLEGIAKRYFGVDDPLYDIYVKRWLISAVARIFEPGCKADCALFLQGVQGTKKSTFFERLAGNGFFSDSLGDTQSNKDEILLMHRFWIHEWAELETVFRKKEMASVKSFMARGFDSVRPPYRRDLIDLKRACVFAGTTNEQAFLSDNTGDRRFWTIPVRGKIPTELLDRERDQIWAAAVALYRSGEQWHLTEEEEIASRELNAQFRSIDPWHEKIAMFVQGHDSVSVNEILSGCFEIELKNISRKESLRVSGILTAIGWESATKRESGKVVRRWIPSQQTPAAVNDQDDELAVGDDELALGDDELVSQDIQSEIAQQPEANTDELSEPEEALMIRLEWCQALSEFHQIRRELEALNPDFVERYWLRLPVAVQERIGALT